MGTCGTLASPSATGVIDNTAHTVTLTVPFATDVTNLSPTITLSPGATIAPLSGVARNFTTPQTYTVTAQDGTTNRTYTVTVTISSNTAKAITTFGFTSPSVAGTVNETNHAVSLTVPFGTNVTALVPTITYTGSSISPPSGVAQDFTNPVTYRVTAADTSHQDYVVTVTITPAPAFTLSLAASNGIVTKSPDQASYGPGTVVTLTAAPNAGYVFSTW